MDIKQQQGVNLIELMVSMTIGIAMLAGVMQIMVTSKTDFLVRDALTNLDETSQYISDMMASDIRNVGFTGCNSTRLTNYQNLVAGFSGLDVRDGLAGLDGNSSGASPSFNTSSWHNISSYTLNSETYRAARQSDILQLWTVVPHGMDVTAINISDTASSQATIAISAETLTAFEMAASNNLEELMLLSDCSNSYVVKTDSIRRTSSGGLVALDLATDKTIIAGLRPPIEAFFLKGVVYYIGKLSSNNKNPPTLYMANVDADGDVTSKQPLVEGVANLQFLYGENSNSSNFSADRYVSANQVSDWSRVNSVRIKMMLETINDRIVPGNGNFTFHYAGRDYQSPDKRLRKEVISTVVLRNRIPGNRS